MGSQFIMEVCVLEFQKELTNSLINKVFDEYTAFLIVNQFKVTESNVSLLRNTLRFYQVTKQISKRGFTPMSCNLQLFKTLHVYICYGSYYSQYVLIMNTGRTHKPRATVKLCLSHDQNVGKSLLQDTSESRTSSSESYLIL